jgi:hypothetical protein
VVREEPKIVKEEPKSKTEEPKKKVEVKSTECNTKDVKNVISTAFSETILPSKSPLPQDDPFSYFTSENYLKMFVLASVAFVIVISLLD